MSPHHATHMSAVNLPRTRLPSEAVVALGAHCTALPVVVFGGEVGAGSN